MLENARDTKNIIGIQRDVAVVIVAVVVRK